MEGKKPKKAMENKGELVKEELWEGDR